MSGRPVIKTRRIRQPPKRKRKKRPSIKTKLAGWEIGVTRSACFYVQDQFHQSVNIAASTLRVSKGIIVERAIAQYLATTPDLESIRLVLESILGQDWPSD